MTVKPTIFVNIAAYRDAELYPTVKDLFEQAKYPDNLHIAICWQHNALREEPFMIEDRKHQVSVIQVDYKKSKGACWARHMIQKLYNGETHFLQIDAHSRLIRHWDEAMINELARCPSAKPILSTYPNQYTLPNELGAMTAYKVFFKEFHNRIPTFASRACEPHELLAPSPSAVTTGGFVFAKAEAMLEVPYDPYIYFIGEEITMSARYWTHGYDIFTPTQAMLFHLYGTPDSGKVHHWSDHADWHDSYEQSSRARVQHLLGIEAATEARALQEIDQYGLGQVRTLTQYEAFAGVNFREQVFEDSATQGTPKIG